MSLDRPTTSPFFIPQTQDTNTNTNNNNFLFLRQNNKNKHQEQTIIMAPLLFMALVLSMTTTSGAMYCVCMDGVPDTVMQTSIDYACGGGADCTPILPGGTCFQPNTVKSHCDFAVNSYFHQMGQVDGSCDFDGAAFITNTLPSNSTVVPGCTYPASASPGQGTTGAPPGTPGAPPGTPGTPPACKSDCNPKGTTSNDSSHNSSRMPTYLSVTLEITAIVVSLTVLVRLCILCGSRARASRR